ncbi:MAG: LemA family protein [Thaumarchaeota archaeon]|nr:MAG: LemA family protein [Nitrososphaerota archaeon]
MRAAVKVGIGIAALVIIIIASLYSMYFSGFNGVQAKDESFKKRAADVDTQLQRRYDLIPNWPEPLYRK